MSHRLGSMASFRICTSLDCRNRLPDFKHDKHSKCSLCIGHVCDLDIKCNECNLWPDEKFKYFLKHRHKLTVARERKARDRQRAREIKISATADKEFCNVSRKRAHSISPSVSSGSGGKVLIVDDVSNNLISSPTLSVASSLSVPRASPRTPTAVPSAPIGDQGITVAQFNELFASVKTMNDRLNSVIDVVHSGFLEFRCSAQLFML